MRQNTVNIRKQFHSQWIILVITVLSLGGVIAFSLYRQHSSIEADECERLAKLANIIDVNIERQLDTINRALVGIRDEISKRKTDKDGTLRVFTRLRAMTEAMPGLRTIIITNADGTVVASNRENIIGRNFSYRDYFKVPRRHPDLNVLYISPPFKTVLGVYSLNLTRALLGPNDEFKGIVTATLNPEFFFTFLKAVQISPGMDVALNHTDGTIFISATRKDIEGKTLARPGTFYTRHVESGQVANLFKGIVYASGLEAIIALRTVKSDKFAADKTLMVAITYKLPYLFAHWRHDAFVQGTVFILLALGGAFGLYLYQRRKRELTRLEADYLNRLQESEERFKFLAENMGDIVWTLDMNFNATYVSPSIEKVLGFTPEERKQQKLEDMVSPDSVKRIMAMYLEELQRDVSKDAYLDRSIGIEVEYYHRNGSIVWIENIVKAIRDETGAIVGMYGVSRDITQRKKAEKALRDSEEKFKLLAEHSADVIYKVNLESEQYTYASPSVEKLLGYSTEEVLSLKAKDTVTEKSYVKQREELINSLASGRNSPQIMELEAVHKDGHIIPVEIHANFIPDELGNPVEILGVSRDITARKKAEQALADSEQRLSDIIEFLPDPTWVIDIEGRVIAWNRAMERASGIDKQEILGKGDHAYAIPFYGKPRPVLIDLVLKPHEQWENEYLSLREDNGLLIASESFHPAMGDGGRYFAGTAGRLYNAQGDVVGAIETIRDITAAKRLEQDRERLIAELQQAIAKVRTLSGFLPICSSCKKIRDDKGYWNQIESYIRDHSEAEFSHSICPECVKKLYPEFHSD